MAQFPEFTIFATPQSAYGETSYPCFIPITFTDATGERMAVKTCDNVIRGTSKQHIYIRTTLTTCRGMARLKGSITDGTHYITNDVRNTRKDTLIISVKGKKLTVFLRISQKSSIFASDFKQ